MIKAFIWFVSRIIEQVNKFLFGFLVLILLFFGYSLISSYIKAHFRDISCKTYYPIKQRYINYSKNHHWKLEQMDASWKILSSYKNEIEDGISISFIKWYNSISDTNETDVMVSSVRYGKETGLTLYYRDNTLSSIQQMELGKREGISIEFYKNIMPTMILVYAEDKPIGEIDFWGDGSLRKMDFNAKNKLKKTWTNSQYTKGQKAYVRKVENGIEYRIIYNMQGEILLKFPVNNDPCKIQLYRQGKRVNIPLYIDTEEVRKIFDMKKSR